MNKNRLKKTISTKEALQDLEKFNYYMNKASIAYYLCNASEKKSIQSRYEGYKQRITKKKKISCRSF